MPKNKSKIFHLYSLEIRIKSSNEAYKNLNILLLLELKDKQHSIYIYILTFGGQRQK